MLFLDTDHAAFNKTAMVLAKILDSCYGNIVKQNDYNRH